jgi:membrane protein YqaA with SNARE-associated domain
MTIDWLKNTKNNIERIAQSPRGLVLLCTICFLEPIILPIFPELILAPVLLSRKKEQLKVLVIALCCTFLGAMTAYTIGYYLGKLVLGYLGSAADLYVKGRAYLHYYGIFLPFIGSMMPLPLKVISWTCGLSHFNVFIFASAVFLGRLFRYSALLLVPQIHKKK